jgi:UPF0716 protein FxsA
VRQQGVSTLIHAQQKMQQGTIPGQEVAEGLLLVIAGIMLVTPGFVTDALGFLFCLPMTRPIIAKGLLAKLSVQVVNQAQGGFSAHSAQGFGHRQPSNDDVIEGEYERKDDQKPDTEKLNKPD